VKISRSVDSGRHCGTLGLDLYVGSIASGGNGYGAGSNYIPIETHSTKRTRFFQIRLLKSLGLPRGTALKSL
jgi:hypothetical protein